MKGFIEVEDREETSILINIRHIVYVNKYIAFDYKRGYHPATLIALHKKEEGKCVTTDESYEEIKRKIEEATE